MFHDVCVVFVVVECSLFLVLAPDYYMYENLCHSVKHFVFYIIVITEKELNSFKLHLFTGNNVIHANI